MNGRNNISFSKVVLLLPVLLWSMFVVTIDACAQSDASIGFRASNGYLLPHGTSMWHLIQGHIQTYELSLISKTDGSKDWHQVLKRPRKGIAIYHARKGIPVEIGSLTSVYGFLDFPLIQGKGWFYYFQFGAGMSYVERNFNNTSNYRNVAMGSKLNLGFEFANRIEYQWDKLSIATGISIIHASSGAYRIPNLGINIPSLDITMSYRIRSKETDALPVESIAYDGKWRFQVLGALGLRAVNPVTNDKYFIRTIQLEGLKKISPIISIGAGIDVFQNEAISKLDVTLNSEDPLLQIGGKASIDLDLDKTSIFLQMGGYLKNKSDYHGGIYHRFGGRYVFSDHYVLSFALKTHFAKADNFEFGVGYRL